MRFSTSRLNQNAIDVSHSCHTNCLAFRVFEGIFFSAFVKRNSSIAIISTANIYENYHFNQPHNTFYSVHRTIDRLLQPVRDEKSVPAVNRSRCRLNGIRNSSSVSLYVRSCLLSADSKSRTIPSNFGLQAFESIRVDLPQRHPNPILLSNLRLLVRMRASKPKVGHSRIVFRF